MRYYKIETNEGRRALMVKRAGLGFTITQKTHTGGVLLARDTAEALALAFTNDNEGLIFEATYYCTA